VKLPVLSIVVVLGLAASAPWLAPLDPHAQEDLVGARWLPPLTRAHRVSEGAHRVRVVTELHQEGDRWTARHAGRALQLDPAHIQGIEPRLYLLGTDGLGRDLASRLAFAVRHSVAVASASVALSLFVGVGLGALAGLARGWWDALLMRFVDLMLALPRLLLFLLVASLTRPSVLLIVAVLGLTSWPPAARLVRAGVRSLRDGGIALAARAEGSSLLRTTLRDLLPQLWPIVTVCGSLLVADTIVLEASLAFLGLGAPSPAISLGSIIAAGRGAPVDSWWILAWPSAVLVALVLITRTIASLAAPGGAALRAFTPQGR
jgi:peptide/nickel transport system permease protein